MAAPIRDLVAQIRLKIKSSDVKKVISDARNLKNKLSKELSPRSTQFKIAIDPKNLKSIRDSLLATRKQIRDSLNPKTFDAANRGVKKLSLSFFLLKTAVVSTAAVFAAFGLKRLVGSLSDVITGTAKTARTIETLSQVTGISERFIENFSFAAEGIGISAEQSRGALSNFTRQIAEGRRGSQEASEAFGLLRVSIFDNNGEAKSATSLFSEVSKALAGVKNPSERARLATKLFGEGTARLLPVLSGAEGSIEDAGRQLDALGGRLSDVTKRESNQFLRSVRDINFSFQGLKDSVLKEALPPLNDFIKTLKDIFISNKDIIRQDISKIFESISSFLSESPFERMESFVESLKSMRESLSELIKIIKPLSIALGLVFGVLLLIKAPIIAVGAALTAALFNPIRNIIDSVNELIKIIPEISTGFSSFIGGITEKLGLDNLRPELTPSFSGGNISASPTSSGTSINSPTSVNISVSGADVQDPRLLSEMIGNKVSEAINSSNREAIEALGIRSSR